MTVQELLENVYESFRPPKLLTVSEWADQNRVLTTESSAEAGKWDSSRAPYQIEIMNAFTQRHIHEIVVMASSQVGKSEIELNMLGRAMDIEPGPMLYIQPTDKTAEDYSKRRIMPMINNCPQLKRKMNSNKDRNGGATITMKTFAGGSLAIIGANSPSDLASKPVRYVFMDEIDRFPASAGSEGDPIELAERRTETFRQNRKIVKTSTPTIKGKSKIERAYLNGTQEEWRTECPECHEYSFIQFNDVKFDKNTFMDADGQKHFAVDNCRWKCPKCGKEFPEYMVKRLNAKWFIKNAEALQNGVRSFRLNAFMSPWASWKSIALSFLKAENDPQLLQVFHNTMLGESFEHVVNVTEPLKLLERRESYDAEVPDDVSVLTMGVDTQDNRLEYEVVGWDRDEQSWGIQHGIIPGRPDTQAVWDALDDILTREWRRSDGVGMRIMATFMDMGGHFTDIVKYQCARRQGMHMYAIKGEGGSDKPYVRLMSKDKTNGNRTVQRATRFLIGVDGGKEAIMYAADINIPGPRFMHFPDNDTAGYDAQYFNGLMSERQVSRRRMGQSYFAWEKVFERNEPLDMRNYARAAYKYFNWNFDKLEQELKEAKEQAEDPPEERQQHTTVQSAPKQSRKYVVSKGVKI